MNHLLKHKFIVLAAVLSVALTSWSPIAFATNVVPPGGGGSPTVTSTSPPPAMTCPAGQVLMPDERSCCPSGTPLNGKSCFFAKYVNPLINLLSALVGVVVVIGIIFGAIQFSASGGDPQKAANGKNHIRNALFGLLAYLLLYALLQFMVPGGVLNG